MLLYTYKEFISRFIKPLLAVVHVFPLSDVKKTPPPLVPAKTIVSIITNDLIPGCVKPTLNSVHVPPLLLEKKTAPLLEPTYIFDPFVAIDQTFNSMGTQF